jgi:hypothetical protein
VTPGGRPDLAGNEVLARIEASTLLIVEENDDEVIKLGSTKDLQRCKKRRNWY